MGWGGSGVLFTLVECGVDFVLMDCMGLFFVLFGGVG